MDIFSREKGKEREKEVLMKVKKSNVGGGNL